MNGYSKEHIMGQIFKTEQELAKEKNAVQILILRERLKKLKKVYQNMQLVSY